MSGSLDFIGTFAICLLGIGDQPVSLLQRRHA
jgi:hypothetical protein